MITVGHLQTKNGEPPSAFVPPSRHRQAVGFKAMITDSDWRKSGQPIGKREPIHGPLPPTPAQALNWTGVLPRQPAAEAERIAWGTPEYGGGGCGGQSSAGAPHGQVPEMFGEAEWCVLRKCRSGSGWFRFKHGCLWCIRSCMHLQPILRLNNKEGEAWTLGMG